LKLRIVRSRGERIENYLFIEGEKEIQVRREVYKWGFFYETVQPRVGGHSCNSLNIPAEIQDLKSGQLVNGEAIKALLESVSYISGVISRLRDCGGKSGNRFPELKHVNQDNLTDHYFDNVIIIIIIIINFTFTR
jgi:hypothetical protein